jgi:predicted amidohydrolase
MSSGAQASLSYILYPILTAMKFAPQVGDIDNNLNRADAVLSKANPKDIDLLVLPEMAFSGRCYRNHFAPLQFWSLSSVV